VLLLKAIYKINILERPKAEKRIVSSPSALESKKAKEIG